MGFDIHNLFGDSKLISARDPGAATGSMFVNNNLAKNGLARENNILEEFLHGNIPDFLRNFTSVTANYLNDEINYLVMPDYLSIGSDSDYVRMPMNPLTAQKIADKYDCTLPTRKMVNDIWHSAANKPAPATITPDPFMSSTGRYYQHSKMVDTTLSTVNKQLLTAGHKKDVVLTNRLAPNNPSKRVAIYGWFYTNGKPIQDLNPSDHDQYYADYSHGIRLIANDVFLNGKLMRMQDVFSNPNYAKLVSDEGVLAFQRY